MLSSEVITRFDIGFLISFEIIKGRLADPAIPEDSPSPVQRVQVCTTMHGSFVEALGMTSNFIIFILQGKYYSD